MKLWLCLFWMKITFGNAFPYLRVFGCTWKMHFPEMVFSWPCFGCKLISVFILPSNTIFRKTKRERELSESEIEEKEKGREHTPPASQTLAREIAPKKRSNPERRAVRLRLHPSTSPFDFAFTPIAIAVTAPIRRPRSRSSHPKTDRPRPQNQSSSFSSFFSQFDRIMIFFFPAFYLCF